MPVKFPPGFSIVSASPASTGSVTALNSIGISLVTCFAACTAGVAIVYIRSTSSLANFSEIVVEVGMSPCAFLKSISASIPSSSSPSSKPFLASSRAGCSANWLIPITNFSSLLASSEVSPVLSLEHPVRSTAPKIKTVTNLLNFLLIIYNSP